jgi:hypothetical protein
VKTRSKDLSSKFDFKIGPLNDLLISNVSVTKSKAGLLISIIAFLAFGRTLFRN